MKKNNRFQLLMVVATIISFSSCNRGYGCPTNFSVDQIIDTVVQAMATIIF